MVVVFCRGYKSRNLVRHKNTACNVYKGNFARRESRAISKVLKYGRYLLT